MNLFHQFVSADIMKNHVQLLLFQMQLEDKDREIEFLKSRLCKYEPIDMVPTGSTRLPACKFFGHYSGVVNSFVWNRPKILTWLKDE